MTTSRAILKFRAADESSIRLSIPRADTNLTTEIVKNVMSDMLNIGIIQTQSGSPNTKHGASLLTTTRTRLV